MQKTSIFPLDFCYRHVTVTTRLQTRKHEKQEINLETRIIKKVFDQKYVFCSRSLTFVADQITSMYFSVITLGLNFNYVRAKYIIVFVLSFNDIIHNNCIHFCFYKLWYYFVIVDLEIIQFNFDSQVKLPKNPNTFEANTSHYNFPENVFTDFLAILMKL